MMRMIQMFDAKGEAIVKEGSDGQKKLMRSRCYSMISGIEPAYFEDANKAILKTLFSNEKLRKAKRVFCVENFDSPLPVKEIVEKCIASGKEVVSEVFFIPAETDGEELVPVKVDADVAIVPALATNKKCHRIGDGTGIYDMALSGTDVYNIGICYDKFVFGNIPTYKDDLSLSVMITESQIIKPVKAGENGVVPHNPQLR